MRNLTIGLSLLLLLLPGCLGYPQAVTPVTGFEIDQYLGRWYEIARLDHSFERGLEKVTADYDLREDGGVRVTNRGFSTKNGKWETADGKAYFVGASDQGYLKVSFFGPFYGSYVIFELDHEDYQYAFVSGPNESYLWLLARTPTVSDALLNKFAENARQKGFNPDNLIYVSHKP
jgi:apolipoprotein D and lipocalin family protein